jgi:GNAT superfamily N-acetyltransferase
VKALNESLIHFFTHIDYDRHMAFVCEHEGRLVGEARYVANPGGDSCEFGVVIADDWHKSGIAGLLIEALIGAARARLRAPPGSLRADHSARSQEAARRAFGAHGGFPIARYSASRNAFSRGSSTRWKSVLFMT